MSIQSTGRKKGKSTKTKVQKKKRDATPQGPVAVLAVQNQNIGPIAVPPPLVVQQPIDWSAPPAEPIGLADPGYAQWWAGHVNTAKKDWNTKTPDERNDIVLEPVNVLFDALKIPRIKKIDREFGDNPMFSGALWSMNCPARFLDGDFDKATFATLANNVYHEARHAEQLFRVARMMATEGRTEGEIANLLTIDGPVARAAKADPLSRLSLREWAEAEVWRANLVGNASALAGAAFDADYGIKDSEAKLEKYQNPDSDEAFRKKYNEYMEHPDGPQRWLDDALAEYDNYLRQREAYRVAFPLYATMPVEADAWARGGEMENRVTDEDPQTALDEYTERLNPANLRPRPVLLVNAPLRFASPAPPQRQPPLPPVPSIPPPPLPPGVRRQAPPPPANDGPPPPLDDVGPPPPPPVVVQPPPPPVVVQPAPPPVVVQPAPPPVVVQPAPPPVVVQPVAQVPPQRLDPTVLPPLPKRLKGIKEVMEAFQ
ncbi:hypothetical protein AB0M02_36165 [Actinoplanes sp. NPDC051861]|uniref:hypothetical protein n=1 Tax=Actinoplanes sp. NPDC051861 TaxID=3155170 RepID=UPI00341E6AB0